MRRTVRGPASAEAVAAEIRAQLGRQAKSRAWLSARTGIAASGLSRRLNGRQEFSVSELAAVADALGVPLTDLLAAA